MPRTWKYKKQTFYVEAAPFHLDVLFCFNMDADAVRRKLRGAFKHYIEEDVDHGLNDWDHPGQRGRCFSYSGTYVVCLWVERLDGLNDAISTLAHEVLHVTSFLLREKGCPLGVPTEEIYAYTFEWIFTRALTRLGVKGSATTHA